MWGLVVRPLPASFLYYLRCRLDGGEACKQVGSRDNDCGEHPDARKRVLRDIASMAASVVGSGNGWGAKVAAAEAKATRISTLEFLTATKRDGNLSPDGSLAGRFRVGERCVDKADLFIDDMTERSWAAEWIAALLAQEKVFVTPDVKDALWSALASLASAPPDERRLTGPAMLLQSNALRTALTAYMCGTGRHGCLRHSTSPRASSSAHATTATLDRVSRLLKQIDCAVPDGLDVHIVMHNYATHKTAKVRAWLAAARTITCTSRRHRRHGLIRSSAGSPN
jgi:hypothetical protein